MALLKTKHLTKNFGALRAVDNVDLRIEEGTVHSIIGPNGAGKTTLFNLLSGLYSPTSGTIHFKEQDITSLKLHQRSRIGIGRSFQITSVFPELTVKENIWLSAQSRTDKSYSIFRKASHLRRVEKKTAVLLHQIELTQFAEQRAGTIPYGSQRSLDMAIALATEPSLLLLDEPTSGMTPEDTQRIIALIRKISESHTIVLIEHHMSVVMSISDRITVLHQGAVIAEGPPEAVKENAQVKQAYFGGQNHE